MYYSSADVNIFAETTFTELDNDDLYFISDNKYSLFRNDAPLRNPQSVFGGTAVYSHLDYYPGYPYCDNRNGVEIKILRFMVIPNVSVVAIYRSHAGSIREMCTCTLKDILESLPTKVTVFIGDFNANWFDDSKCEPLYNFFIRDNGYRVSCTVVQQIAILVLIIYTPIYQNHKQHFKF